MRFRAVFVVTLCLAGIALAACSREPVVFGDPGAAKFSKISTAMLRQSAVDMMGRPVVIGEKFLMSLGTEFAEGHEAFLCKGDFGEIVILCPLGKYSDQIKSLRKGRPIVAYGFVTTIIPPGKQRALIAVSVE